MDINDLLSIYYQWWSDSDAELAEWDENTIIYYYGLVFGISFIALLAELFKHRISSRYLSIFFIVDALILILFSGLRADTVGIDTKNYIRCFVNGNDPSFVDENLEFGYRLLMTFMRNIISNSQIFLLLMSTLTVGSVFIVLWRFRKRINLFVAVLLYVCIFYFQSFDLLRIYLASSLLMLSFCIVFEDFKYKYQIFAACILLIATLHYTSAILLFPLVLYLFYKYDKVLSFGLMIGLLVGAYLLLPYLSDIFTSSKYQDYFDDLSVGNSIGIMMIADILPLIFAVIYIIFYRRFNRWTDWFICFAFVAFAIRLFTYFLPPAGRLSIQTMILFVLLLPRFVTYLSHKNKGASYAFVFLIVVFAFVKLHIYFLANLAKDGIMPYNFCWE